MPCKNTAGRRKICARVWKLKYDRRYRNMQPDNHMQSTPARPGQKAQQSEFTQRPRKMKLKAVHDNDRRKERKEKTTMTSRRTRTKTMKTTKTTKREKPERTDQPRRSGPRWLIMPVFDAVARPGIPKTTQNGELRVGTLLWVPESACSECTRAAKFTAKQQA